VLRGHQVGVPHRVGELPAQLGVLVDVHDLVGLLHPAFDDAVEHAPGAAGAVEAVPEAVQRVALQAHRAGHHHLPGVVQAHLVLQQEVFDVGVDVPVLVDEGQGRGSLGGHPAHAHEVLVGEEEALLVVLFPLLAAFDAQPDVDADHGASSPATQPSQAEQAAEQRAAQAALDQAALAEALALDLRELLVEVVKVRGTPQTVADQTPSARGSKRRRTHPLGEEAVSAVTPGPAAYTSQKPSMSVVPL
jgi:hypothetical protein